MLKIDPSLLRLQRDPVFARVERAIAQRISDDVTFLASGRCADFADYKARTAGIKAAVRVLEDLRESVNTYLQEDDDD